MQTPNNKKIIALWCRWLPYLCR